MEEITGSSLIEAQAYVLRRLRYLERLIKERSSQGKQVEMEKNEAYGLRLGLRALELWKADIDDEDTAMRLLIEALPWLERLERLEKLKQTDRDDIDDLLGRVRTLIRRSS